MHIRFPRTGPSLRPQTPRQSRRAQASRHPVPANIQEARAFIREAAVDVNHLEMPRKPLRQHLDDAWRKLRAGARSVRQAIATAAVRWLVTFPSKVAERAKSSRPVGRTTLLLSLAHMAVLSILISIAKWRRRRSTR